MSKPIRAIPVLLLLVTLGLGLAACGEAAGARTDLGFGGGEAAQRVDIRVDPGGRLAWERAEYEATAGDMTFVVGNPTDLTHDFGIEGPGVSAQSEPFPGGATRHFTLTGLPPGTYQIVCSIPGHRQAGMVAILRVR